MTFRRSHANADEPCRRRAGARANSRAGTLRRGGRAIAAALRRHGPQAQSLTGRLMGDPPPGRSALNKRACGPAGQAASVRDFDRDIPFAGPVELIEPADPYEDMDPAMLGNATVPGE